MTEIEMLITKSLPRFDEENPLYYKPTTLAEWESTWDFGEYDANAAHCFFCISFGHLTFFQ